MALLVIRMGSTLEESCASARISDDVAGFLPLKDKCNVGDVYFVWEVEGTPDTEEARSIMLGQRPYYGVAVTESKDIRRVPVIHYPDFLAAMQGK